MNKDNKAFSESMRQLSPHEIIEKIDDRFGIPDDEVFPEPGPVPKLKQEERLFEQLSENARSLTMRQSPKPK